MASTSSDKASVLGLRFDNNELNRGAAHLAWHMIEQARERAASPSFTVSDAIITILQQNDSDLLSASEEAFTRSAERVTSVSGLIARMQMQQEEALLADATKMFALPDGVRSSALRQAVVAYLPLRGTGNVHPSMQ